AYTCVASGMNSNKISNGTVGVISLTVAAGASSTPIGIVNAMAVSPTGNSISVSGLGGTVTGSASLPTVTGVTCTTSAVGSSSSTACIVTLSGGAMSGGAVVTLSTSNSVLTVPGSVTVAAGSAVGTFNATTGGISNDQSATLTAEYNGSSAN